MKEGYYPLSSNVLKKAHGHYEWDVLPFLLEVGYLERSPYKYSSVYGICYYYKINGERFITDAPQPKPKRISKAQARADQIRAYKQEHPNMSNRAVVRALGIPETTVRRLLKMWAFWRAWPPSLWRSVHDAVSVCPSP